MKKLLLTLLIFLLPALSFAEIKLSSVSSTVSPTFTGITTIAAGTAAAPSLVFASDADSGFYYNAKGFGYAVDGASVFTLSSAGGLTSNSFVQSGSTGTGTFYGNNLVGTGGPFMIHNAANGGPISVGKRTHTVASGTFVVGGPEPTYNQVAATTSNKDWRFFRTETSLGSGDQYFWTAETAAGFVVGLTNKGHLITDDLVAGTQPALTTCGVTPAIGSSTDMAGIATIGGGGAVTACTITFGTAYTNEPSCIITPQSNVTAYISASSASAITVTFSADVQSTKFNYHCIGQNGGH